MSQPEGPPATPPDQPRRGIPARAWDRAASLGRSVISFLREPWRPATPPRNRADFEVPSKPRADEDEAHVADRAANADPAHALRLLDILMQDARAMNAHYDVRNGVFVPINVALLGAVAAKAPDLSAVSMTAGGALGVCLSRAWANVLTMGKHFQQGRELDLRDFIWRGKEARAIFTPPGGVPPIPRTADRRCRLSPLR